MTAPAHRWNAEDYAANSSAQYEWGRELLERIPLQGHEHILDLGCGDGKLTALLAARVPRGTVTGIDSSTDMLALAQRHWAGGNLSFRPMDMQVLGFEAAFDVVYSNSAVHWAADHPAILAGVHRALRPGGRLLMQAPGAGNCAGFVAAADSVRREERWREYFRDFRFPWCFVTADEYRQWLPAAGLVVDYLKPMNLDMCHADRAALAGWFRSTWMPYLDRVPAPQRDAFAEAVVEAYLARWPQDRDGSTHVAMVRLEVAAHRQEASVATMAG
jgi:trans-aconitate methyltransferase